MSWKMAELSTLPSDGPRQKEPPLCVKANDQT
jgi:hypothetical protein